MIFLAVVLYVLMALFVGVCWVRKFGGNDAVILCLAMLFWWIVLFLAFLYALAALAIKIAKRVDRKNEQ